MKKTTLLGTLAAGALLFTGICWGETINVNSASAEVLDKILDNVGPAKAAAIVSYRDTHGPFKSLDELGHVSGIGAATLEANRDRIVFSDE